MSRRTFDLRHDIDALTLAHSTWIHSVYLNAQGGGTPYDDSWIQPLFTTHSTWISSLGAWIATKQNSFDLASKADSSWVGSLGDWTTAQSSLFATKADSGSVLGLPVGGNPGQALTKVSSTNYDVTWSTVSGGGGASDGLYWALVAGGYP